MARHGSLRRYRLGPFGPILWFAVYPASANGNCLGIAALVEHRRKLEFDFRRHCFGHCHLGFYVVGHDLLRCECFVCTRVKEPHTPNQFLPRGRCLAGIYGCIIAFRWMPGGCRSDGSRCLSLYTVTSFVNWHVRRITERGAEKRLVPATLGESCCSSLLSALSPNSSIATGVSRAGITAATRKGVKALDTIGCDVTLPASEKSHGPIDFQAIAGSNP